MHKMRLTEVLYFILVFHQTANKCKLQTHSGNEHDPNLEHFLLTLGPTVLYSTSNKVPKTLDSVFEDKLGSHPQSLFVIISHIRLIPDFHGFLLFTEQRANSLARFFHSCQAETLESYRLGLNSNFDAP